MTTEAPEAIALTRREYETYEILRRSFPGFVTLSAFSIEMWGEMSPATYTATRLYIMRLRRKIGAARIKTVSCYGYRLVEEVPVVHSERRYRN